ncbi:hypothetical protein CC2G_001466 [Coprinopsis cinerea AmutBmut pab1-1]|nr:hypothetical protein CC2G_001466 [Coprinopsis cinerea AmutBmut pab1-1]
MDSVIIPIHCPDNQTSPPNAKLCPNSPSQYPWRGHRRLPETIWDASCQVPQPTLVGGIPLTIWASTAYSPESKDLHSYPATDRLWLYDSTTPMARLSRPLAYVLQFKRIIYPDPVIQFVFVNLGALVSALLELGCLKGVSLWN